MHLDQTFFVPETTNIYFQRECISGPHLEGTERVHSNTSNGYMKETATAFRQRREPLTTTSFSIFLSISESHELPHTVCELFLWKAGMLADAGICSN